MSARTILLGVLGLVAAVGVGLAANAISRDSIGLAPTPQGATLAPPAATTTTQAAATPAAKRPKPARTDPHDPARAGHHRGAGPAPAPAPTTTFDDHGGGEQRRQRQGPRRRLATDVSAAGAVTASLARSGAPSGCQVKRNCCGRVQRLAQRPEARRVRAQRPQGDPARGARAAALDGHRVGAAGAHLAPERRGARRCTLTWNGFWNVASAGLGRSSAKRSPDCQPEYLTSDVAAAQRLVAPLVLRQQPHPRVAPREVGAVLQPARLLGERDALDRVGRVASGSRTRSAAAAEVRAAGRVAQPAARAARRRARAPGAAGRRSTPRRGCVRGTAGGERRRVRVVGEAVRGQRLEAARTRPCGRGGSARRRTPSARMKASGRVRAFALRRRVAARGQRAERAPCAPGSAAAIAGCAARTSWRYRCGAYGRAALARARVLRLQPERQVGLVPDHVAVDGGAVAARDRRGELAEELRARLVARGCPRDGVADGPQRPRAR